MHSQLLYIGSSAKALENYGGRTRKGWQTGLDWHQHTRKCPSPVLPQREETRCTLKIIPQKE